MLSWLLNVVMVVLFVVLASIPQTALSIFTYTYMKFLSFLTQRLSFCSTNVVRHYEPQRSGI